MALQKINYLKLEDLKIGMEVETKQLERIYDVYIILSNVRVRQLRRDVSVTGIIKEFNERQLCAVEDGDALFFNSSLQAMENGTYYEEQLLD